MCTVSIIAVPSAECAGAPGPPGLRVVCNRDESRQRVAAAAPRWHPIGSGPSRAIWPMDLQAGGTWIAASQRGLCLCLLNLNLDEPVDLPPARQLRSRGLVIPGLIGAAELNEAVDRLRRLPLDRFAPFRLVGIEHSAGGSARVVEARWDRAGLGVVWHAGPPVCFASSGLGDGLVAPPRLELFEEMVVGAGALPERQDEFHRHVWPDRPELSVMMSRADARTVSVTTLEVAGNGSEPRVAMAYEPIVEGALFPAGVAPPSMLR